MRFSIISLIILAFWLSVGAKGTNHLQSVEKAYRDAKTVSMKVNKTIRMELLQKETKSKGKMVIKKGGLLRWDVEGPEKSLVLMDGKVIWMVTYPSDPEEKVSVIKANNPKKSQPHAVIAFLMGKGKISDEFKVLSEKKQGADLVEISLKAKQEEAQIPVLTLVVHAKKNTIESVTYQDAMGNETELSFSDIEFDKELGEKTFQFSPPENADINVI